ncbi:alpha/beta fold hydrolase BchO [uncultured Enterovirga sp.]|uniref:alpha/beta fold hydrolase BchO n=1 Tax=uncultured Enterovirga sp. TaxID=2026352 RepID=UPI0035CB79C9
MSRDLVWDRDGRQWPNREASTFARVGRLSWHVQVAGEGPVLVLAHGMGASTHSWRDVLPALARHFTVVAPDLPGHAFTSRPPSSRGLSMPGMAVDLGALLAALGREPALAVGHSAGAAILCRMVLDGRIQPKGLVSLNGALLGFRGVAGHLFSPLAKLLASNDLAARLIVATMSSRSSVERLIADQGSSLDRTGIDLYRRLVGSPSHVGAALGMMANWELDAFERDLPGLAIPLLQIVGSNDRSVPPSTAAKVRSLVPGTTIDERRGLGHLAHEERPHEIADRIIAFARAIQVLDASPVEQEACAATSPGYPAGPVDPSIRKP